jgi:GNAT superfamily N-acetyltransferase
MAMQHAPLLHQLYLCTPDYFSLLGTRPPSLGEVEHDVQTALFDPRRCLELIYPEDSRQDDSQQEGHPQADPIGSLDYKLDFPEPGDVTINLLMVRGDLQSSGLGQQAVRQLELRLRELLKGHPGPASSRLFASVLGKNPRAVAFWERLGFSFATDARPVMTWYAKPLDRSHAAPVAAGHRTAKTAAR